MINVKPQHLSFQESFVQRAFREGAFVLTVPADNDHIYPVIGCWVNPFFRHLEISSIR